MAFVVDGLFTEKAIIQIEQVSVVGKRVFNLAVEDLLVIFVQLVDDIDQGVDMLLGQFLFRIGQDLADVLQYLAQFHNRFFLTGEGIGIKELPSSRSFNMSVAFAIVLWSAESSTVTKLPILRS